ncbi:uncharacterized protein LOC111486561 [Cucurbita maxima]|uniref:Uncharacterized protein LOC111486561 n=1 Tax=Cucurbita maxima TaxID=3661 RepID=A0A6J1JPI4_CUCMA|nr:uncharacterized protein LOC111486561 [Cucurbita maxima]
MKLVAENLTGSLFYVEVDDGATVLDLRTEISSQQSLPSDRLLFVPDHDRGRLISVADDGISLVDFGLRDGSLIYIFFCPLDDDGGDDVDARQLFFNCPDLLLFQ